MDFKSLFGRIFGNTNPIVVPEPVPAPSDVPPTIRPRGRPRKLTAEVCAALIARGNAEHLTRIKLAEIAGTCPFTMSRAFERFGLEYSRKSPDRGIPEERYREVYERAVRDGLTLSYCGKLLGGITRERVRQVFTSFGDYGLSGPRMRVAWTNRQEKKISDYDASLRQVTCVICERPFPSRSKNPNKKTCGAVCRSLFYRARLRLFPELKQKHRLIVKKRKEQIRGLDPTQTTLGPDRVDTGSWQENSHARLAELEVLRLRAETRREKESK